MAARVRSAAYKRKERIKSRKRMAASRRNDPEKHRVANRAWAARTREKNPEKMLWFQARGRASTKGVPFDITPEDVVIPAHCPVFGFPLARSTGVKAYNSPSLDRFAPKKGYVRGNVFVISHLANQIKNSGTAEQHRLVAAWMDRQKKE